MNPLYWIHPPCTDPRKPKYWSYSALKEWKSCPKRWWLRNSRYPNWDSSRYPELVSPAAVTGTIVHRGLEAFHEHLKDEIASRGDSIELIDLLRSFGLRSFMLKACSVLREEYLSNPRIDVDTLFARVSVDDCINTFKDLLQLERDFIKLPRQSGYSDGGMKSGVPSMREHQVRSHKLRLLDLF